jgi:hypothetical protein
MVADELRRQADQFIDIIELQSKIGRDPNERPQREPREMRSEPREQREPREPREQRDVSRHTPQFLQRSPQRVDVEDEFEDD